MKGLAQAPEARLCPRCLPQDMAGIMAVILAPGRPTGRIDPRCAGPGACRPGGAQAP